MSKVSMPRPRYVAFRLTGGPVSRRAVGNAIRERARSEGWPDQDVPQLTRFAWPHGIVRVEHTFAQKARALLGRITAASDGSGKATISVETLATSGTLKALTTSVGVLTERDDPKAPRPADKGAARPDGGPQAARKGAPSRQPPRAPRQA